MSLPTTLRDLAIRIAPRWLQGPNAGAALYSWGLLNDASATAETEGWRAGLPGLCNEDSLPYLGRDRLIARGPSEPANLYAARLTNARQSHKKRAGNSELLRQIQNFWSPTFRTVTLVQDNSIWYSIDPSGTVTRTDMSATPNWRWDANAGGAGGSSTPRWWRFWIIVSGAPYFKWKWGDGHHYGDPQLVWGTTMPATWVNQLRGIIRTFKAQDTICDRIILTYDPTILLPTNTGAGMPDGTWDVATNRVQPATYLQGVN